MPITIRLTQIRPLVMSGLFWMKEAEISRAIMPTSSTVGTKSVTLVRGAPLGMEPFSLRNRKARISADTTAPSSTAQKMLGRPR